MSFVGYATITNPRFPITHRLDQGTSALRAHPTPLFAGQDWSDLTHLLLDPAKVSVLSYRTSDVHDGFVLIKSGTDGIVFDKTGKILKESAYFADRSGEALDLETLKARALPLDQAVFIGIDPGWWTYYHWFAISIARMGINLTCFDDGAPIVVAPYRDDGSMRFSERVRSDMLDLVGPRDRFLELKDGIYHSPRIRLAWLDHPQQAYISYMHAFRSVMNRLREGVGIADVRPSRRVILLRDSDQRLSAPAVAALESMIARDGFTVARPERLGLVEQARLFAEAECVIAPHGAGLSNIVFGGSELRVLELNNEYDGPYVRPWYYLLAATAGQRYAYLNQTRSSFDADAIRAMALRFAEGSPP